MMIYHRMADECAEAARRCADVRVRRLYEEERDLWLLLERGRQAIQETLKKLGELEDRAG